MRESKINLLLHGEDTKRIEKIFSRLRLVTLSYSIIVVVAAIVFVVINISLSSEIARLNTEKKQYLEQVNRLGPNEANFNYIAKKVKVIDELISKDPEIGAYFQVVKNVMPSGTESASLKSFSVDESRAVNFSVSASNLENALNFVRTAESAEFLSNFESLSLGQINTSLSSSEAVELSFSGVLKKINGSKN